MLKRHGKLKWGADGQRGAPCLMLHKMHGLLDLPMHLDALAIS